jgi:hypothetical protein
MEGPPVVVTNTDRDGNLVLSGGVTTYVTTESAASASHTKNVALSVTRKPTDTVTVTMTISNTAEGEIIGPATSPVQNAPNKKALTFTPAEVVGSSLTKSFTIQGKDDGVRDGDKSYTISFLVESPDPEFNGLYLPPLNVTNTDDGIVGTP